MPKIPIPHNLIQLKNNKKKIFLYFLSIPRGLTTKTRSLWREEEEEPMRSGAMGWSSDLIHTVWATYITLPNAMMMMMMLEITMARNLMLNLGKTERKEILWSLFATLRNKKLSQIQFLMRWMRCHFRCVIYFEMKSKELID